MPGSLFASKPRKSLVETEASRGAFIAIFLHVIGAIRKSVPADVATRLEQINGQPSVIYSPPDGRAGRVLTFDISNELIQNIQIVTNPGKLSRCLPNVGCASPKLYPHRKSGDSLARQLEEKTWRGVPTKNSVGRPLAK